VKRSVVICIITYKHAAFVKKAIQSILDQSYRNFNLIICDDASVDGTVAVCADFQKNYPDKITFFPSDTNIGMMPNFIRCLLKAKAEMIAICEGDDYWTDPEKLQMQVDHLDSNAEQVLCFHNADVVNSDDTCILRKFSTYQRDTYRGEDLLHQWLIPTASVLFRNVLKPTLPVFFNKSTHGDLALFLYLSQFGTLGFIDRTMSAYRINDQSVTMSGFKGIAHNEAHIAQCREMMEYFNPRFKKLLKRRIAEYSCSTAYLYIRDNNRVKAWAYLRSAARMSPITCIKGVKYFLGTLFYLVFPI